MTVITFNEISYTANKKGICPICNKKAYRTKKFWQTQNTSNLNKWGFVKSKEEIFKECREQANRWKTLPTYHAKCEPKAY